MAKDVRWSSSRWISDLHTSGQPANRFSGLHVICSNYSDGSIPSL